MKKMINIKNGVIIILCVTIVFMALGFIFISMKINKLQKQENNYDVSFVSFYKNSSIKGDKIDPEGEIEIVSNGKELDMNFTLQAAHDEISYVVLIKNKGTMKAKIIDLFASPDYEDNYFKKIIEPVTVTYSDLKGKVLEPEEEAELKIVACYNPSTLSGRRNFKYKIALITENIK